LTGHSSVMHRPANAEYGAEFRTDLEAIVSHEELNACTDPEVERPYDPTRNYVGFCDPSGGSSDSMTLAIAHLEDNITVLDLVREVVPPFVPGLVVEKFADVLKQYKIRTARGDRYAGEWPPEHFSRNGITYEHSELNKSEIYREFLPLLNSRTVALLQNDRLHRQLLSLERRTGAAGREIIDHPRGGRDDLANAVAGAVVLVTVGPRAGRGQRSIVRSTTAIMEPLHDRNSSCVDSIAPANGERFGVGRLGLLRSIVSFGARHTVNLMFWLSRKKLVGSYFFFKATSCAYFAGPYAAFTRSTPSSASCPR
jgi:hypothetical protein